MYQEINSYETNDASQHYDTRSCIEYSMLVERLIKLSVSFVDFSFLQMIDSISLGLIIFESGLL